MEPKPDSKDLTPEERLFKIIKENEGSQKSGDTAFVRGEPETEAQRPKGPKGKWHFPVHLGLGHGAGALSQPVTAKVRDRRPIALSAARVNLSIRTFNGALWVVFLGFMSYFIAGQVFFKNSPIAKLMAKAQSASVAASLDVPPDLFSVQEVDQSRELLSSRNIFQPYQPQARPKPAPEVQPQEARSNLAAIASRMKLTGTYLSDQNEALIELLDEKRTVSVPQGGTVLGVTVKEVRSNSVVLTDGVKEYVLQ